MGSGTTEKQGPDLTAGVPVADLRDGEPLLGHVGEEAVILVRRGEEILGIGATCTHYGGPLAEGLVVGDTVRCPWHHACFSLRTGEAIAAPALNPVARCEVEVRNGRAYARLIDPVPPLESLGRRAQGPESVVIVGAGAAGSAAAEMLRREGYEGPITMIDPDADAPYDRPNLSKDYLAGTAPEEWLPLRPSGFHAEHRIERVLARAAALDVRNRVVHLDDGRRLPYGALLLVTGATPVRLQIPGADLPHVHLLRSITDCRRIIAATEQARRAVVLGASFIGMEVAASLRSRGLEVTVVAPEAVPFERTLGAGLGAIIRDAHEANGVKFRLGHTAAAIAPNSVTLDDGTELPAELVIVGVGVRPDTRLAEAAGLEVDNGVIVDDRLRASAPGVFAAGDIARYPDPRGDGRIRVEHWVVAQRQGQAAARNILGRDIPFTDPPFFWTHQFDVTIDYVGHGSGSDEIVIDGDPSARDATVRYVRDGKVRAVATLGRNLESLKAEAAMQADPAGAAA